MRKTTKRYRPEGETLRRLKRHARWNGILGGIMFATPLVASQMGLHPFNYVYGYFWWLIGLALFTCIEVQRYGTKQQAELAASRVVPVSIGLALVGYVVLWGVGFLFYAIAHATP